MMVFPDLARKPFGYLNINLRAKERWESGAYRPAVAENPFLNPNACWAIIDRAHLDMCLEWSYGGWMEDRSFIWRGSYLEEEKKFLHLGVDFNARAGTRVAISRPGYVLAIGDDHPQKGGWGPHVYVRLDDNIVLIYAHLGDVAVQAHRRIKAGTILGVVGAPDRNGYWFPHTHVQAMPVEMYEWYQKNPDEFDGYGGLLHLPSWCKTHPDPLQWVDLK